MPMLLKIINILLCFIVPFACIGASREEKHALQDSAMHYLAVGDYDKAEVFGQKLFDLAYKDGDYHDFVIYGHMILGQVSLHRGDSVRAFGHYGQAEQNTHGAANEKLEKEKSHNIALSVCATLAILLVALLTFLAIRRSQFKHREAEMLRKEQEIIEKEKELLAKESEPQTASKYSSSSLSEEKKASLMTDLERLLSEQHAYKQLFVTCDDLAQKLGTNRTYLSQVINSITGQTFTQYLNSFRAKEALRLLDDANCKLSLKEICAAVGFSSQTTFYSQIQKLTGVTPSEYRKTRRG